MKRRQFTFKLTYFDRGGKALMVDKLHQYDAIYDEHGLPVMRHVASHIRGLRDCDAQDDPLPSGWLGHILIEYKGCNPVLVVAHE